MDISQIEKKYIDELLALRDADSQCDYLIMLGIQKKCDGALREDQYRIEGCQTAIWITTGLIQGQVFMTGDSDSLLVRGVLAIFQELYDGRCLAEVRACPPRFLDYISDQVIYPEIKKNGLLKCYKKLRGEGEYEICYGC